MTICTGNPNQKWAWDTPDEVNGLLVNIQTIMSEEIILRTYWDEWTSRMFRIGKGLFCTPENCIDNILVVNWAYKYSGSYFGVGPREILEGVLK